MAILILPQETAWRIGILLSRHRRRRRPVKPLGTDDVLVVVLLARPPHRRHRRHRRRRLHCGLNRRWHSDLAAGHADPRREVKLVRDACAVEELLRGLAPGQLFSDVIRFIGSKFHL